MFFFFFCFIDIYTLKQFNLYNVDLSLFLSFYSFISFTFSVFLSSTQVGGLPPGLAHLAQCSMGAWQGVRGTPRRIFNTFAGIDFNIDAERLAIYTKPSSSCIF